MSRRRGAKSLDRRQFVGLTGAGMVALSTAGPSCSKDDSATTPEVPPPPADSKLVRLASVPTAVEGNVLPELIKDFEARGAYRVQLTTDARLYEAARAGKVDLAISHYGHHDAEGFVLEGLGEWPRTVFSNQMALVGPPADPAKVRGLEDVGEAFHRIATTKSKFVLNEIDGVRYLSEVLWHAAGMPDRTGWWIEPNASKDGAIKHAAELGAYALWGLTPFLRLDGASPLALEPLVLADPLLQRMMVSIIVKPGGPRATNVAGATALQSYLLEPRVQARIRTIRYPGHNAVTWVPAGRHNRTAMLPKPEK